MNYRILWVEDDYYKIGDLVKPLIDDGCEIVVYEDMNAVVQNMDALRDFDIVLLDILIPSGEHPLKDSGVIKEYVGVDLLREVRDVYPKLPIFVLSVVSDDVIIKKIKDCGADKIIPKGGCFPSKLKQEIYGYFESK